jgi:hypothetical protein
MSRHGLGFQSLALLPSDLDFRSAEKPFCRSASIHNLGVLRQFQLCVPPALDVCKGSGLNDVDRFALLVS